MTEESHWGQAPTYVAANQLDSSARISASDLCRRIELDNIGELEGRTLICVFPKPGISTRIYIQLLRTDRNEYGRMYQAPAITRTVKVEVYCRRPGLGAIFNVDGPSSLLLSDCLHELGQCHCGVFRGAERVIQCSSQLLHRP